VILFANEYEVSRLGMKPFAEVFHTRSIFVLSEIHGVGIFDSIERPTGDGKGKGKKKPLKILDRPLLSTTGVAEQLDKVIECNCGLSGTLNTCRWICGITFEEVNDEGQLVRACEVAKGTFKASEKGLRQWYAGVTTSARWRLCLSCSGRRGLCLHYTRRDGLASNWGKFIWALTNSKLSLCYCVTLTAF